jgi:soluble lytic murein transglycosylase-like protein
LPLVRGLLHGVAEANLRSGKIEPKFHQVYRWLVLSTAWQESCWRQFVKQNGTIVPIESPIGSVGLMQVNQRVWRGFYDLQALRRDIGYNGKAGGEILAHYLVNYAIARGEHEKTGSIDNLARATYAAYNGGPGQLTRYRDPKAKKFLRKIDALFWDKYRTVQAGNELAVAQCFGQ